MMSPMAPRQPCAEPGCGRLGEGVRCPTHAIRRMSGRALQRRREVEVVGQRCRHCGEPAEELDHIVPLSRGGPDTAANRQPMCRRCHQTKTTEQRR